MALDSLDSHLFKCADINRSTVDTTDYKDYNLHYDCYKTIFDTYRDQYEEKLEEYGDLDIANRPALFEFVVPEEYSWDKPRNRTD